jgi:hypothetical protein
MARSIYVQPPDNDPFNGADLTQNAGISIDPRLTQAMQNVADAVNTLNYTADFVLLGIIFASLIRWLKKKLVNYLTSNN